MGRPQGRLHGRPQGCLQGPRQGRLQGRMRGRLRGCLHGRRQGRIQIRLSSFDERWTLDVQGHWDIEHATTRAYSISRGVPVEHAVSVKQGGAVSLGGWLMAIVESAVGRGSVAWSEAVMWRANRKGTCYISECD